MAAKNDGIECIELDSDSDDDSFVLEVLPPKKAPTKSCDNDSDSDDSLLFGSGPVFSKNAAADAAHYSNKSNNNKQAAKKKLTREERGEQRRREKERRQEQKQREKEQRQEERTRKKREKEQAKIAEQESKRRRILLAQQTSGKFAEKEICVLMEPSLLQRFENTEVLMETYAVHPHSMPGCTQKGTIRWIRKDFTAGGAEDAIHALQAGVTNGYQLLDRVAIVFYDPKEFIQMLQRSDEDDDFPLLESWLNTIQYSTGKLVLLIRGAFEELNKQWNVHRRVRQDTPPPTDAELKDAIVWLLIQFQVECIPCSTEETLLLNLKKMTRALSEEPYQQHTTELECIKKLKSECSDNCDNFEKAHDTWIRQLQQVPRVSEGMARNVAQYFPTARSLWDAYQDPNRSQSEKRMLLAPLFTEGRQQSKLSDTVYRLMTSSNPTELL